MRTEQEARILLTIQTLLRKPPPYDLTEVLPLDILKNSLMDNNQIIAACIWAVYGALIGMADMGKIRKLVFKKIFSIDITGHY